MAVVEIDHTLDTTTTGATYRAAVVHEFKEPLVVEEVAAPDPLPARSA